MYFQKSRAFEWVLCFLFWSFCERIQETKLHWFLLMGDVKLFYNLINLFFFCLFSLSQAGLRTLPLNCIWKAEIPKAAESLGAQTSLGVLLLNDAERLQKSKIWVERERKKQGSWMWRCWGFCVQTAGDNSQKSINSLLLWHNLAEFPEPQSKIICIYSMPRIPILGWEKALGDPSTQISILMKAPGQAGDQTEAIQITCKNLV